METIKGCNICCNAPAVGTITRVMPNGVSVEFTPCETCLSISEKYCYTVCINCDQQSWTEKEYVGKKEGRVFGRRFEVYLVNRCLVCDDEHKNKFPI